MHRRDFIKSTAIGAGAFVLPSAFHCSESSRPELFLPKGSPPKKLWRLDMDETNWHKKTTLSCMQGLVNREETRVYLNSTKQDQFWLEYYQQMWGIEADSLRDANTFFERFAPEITGYILYDPAMPHSLNLAASMGALKNAIPVSIKFEADFQNFGLKQIDEFIDQRWDNLHFAYEWAIENILPYCNKKLVAQLCVHPPHWPTSTFANRDYAMAHKVFSFDLSTSERDKKDYNLVRKIYESYDPGAVVIGWHCVRDKEHEAIALSSEFGHYGLCSLHTPNLTVHSSIRAQKTKFEQRRLDPQDLHVENKVYVAFMATDGDAAWFMLDHVMNDWASPAHGKIKYNWGFLPMAYDLAPGTVQYYLENMAPEDYFVAGPAGATYTYPHLHPDPAPFLKMTADYMEKCGLTTVHMTNWNDRDWWQEVDLPDFPALLRKHLPNAVGYVRGMGESAFEPHYLDGGKPYVFCGEGIHRGDDIYQTMKDFIDACPNRPLFVYNLVNHSVPIHDIKEAMDKFSSDEIELVHLDELLLLIQKAYADGKITKELYPEKEGLRRILAKEARAAWPGIKSSVAELLKMSSSEAAYIKNLRETPIGLETINAGEMLAFAVIWDAMTVVKRALEMKGIYVNHKPTANKDFLREFSTVPDVGIVTELAQLWASWHASSPQFDEAKSYLVRLSGLVDRLETNLITGRI